MNTEEVVSKPSKGELFKRKHGYSKTMRRNMLRNGVATVDEYRAERKEERKERKKVVKMKRDKARAGRSGKPRLTGKKKPTGKRK